MTQGSFERTMTSHYKDLRGIYSKRMECHGVGMALMHPISGEDCGPVCAGYFDRNGDWNLITRLTAQTADELDDYFYPLEYQPRPSAQVEITWQPKTSIGVSAMTFDASGETPEALPAGAGADMHVKYSSNSKFGAVLMTQKPVTLRAYNDEALFCSWLSRNMSKLYDRYGPELKKYGLWIVTRTYTTKQASISAWQDKNKDQVVSLKAKAAMLGELGEDLDWRDKASDKDWSNYTAKTNHGVVVFMDGIEVPAFDWWLEGVRSNLASGNSDRGRRLLKYMPDPVHHQATFDTHNYGKTLTQLDREAAQKQRASYAEAQRKSNVAESGSPPPRNSSAMSQLRHSIALSPRRRVGSISPGHDTRVTSPPPRVRGQSMGAVRPISEVEPFSHRPSEAGQLLPRQEQPSQKRHSLVESVEPAGLGIHSPKARDWHPDGHNAHPLQHHRQPSGAHEAVEPASNGAPAQTQTSHEAHKQASPGVDEAQAAHGSPDSRSSDKRASDAATHPSRYQTPEHDPPQRKPDAAYEFFGASMPPQHHSSSVPPYRRRHFSDDAHTLIADEDVLKDAGLASSLSRTPSVRRPSIASIRSKRSLTPSLRRETRSISQEPI